MQRRSVTRWAGCPLSSVRRSRLPGYAGYTQWDVAALTGVPLGAVKSRMFSGVQRLRSVLGPLLGEFVTDISGGAR